MRKNIEDLKNTVNQLDQIDIYRHHLTPAEYFLSEHTKFTKIGYTLDHENSLNKFKWIPVKPSMFSVHNRIELEINCKNLWKTHKWLEINYHTFK